MKKYLKLPTLFYTPKEDLYVDTLFSSHVDLKLEHHFNLVKYTTPQQFYISFFNLNFFEKKQKTFFKLFLCKKFNHWNSSFAPEEPISYYDALAWVQVAQWQSSLDFTLHINTAIHLFANSELHAEEWINKFSSEFILETF